MVRKTNTRDGRNCGFYAVHHERGGERGAAARPVGQTTIVAHTS